MRPDPPVRRRRVSAGTRRDAKGRTTPLEETVEIHEIWCEIEEDWVRCTDYLRHHEPRTPGIPPELPDGSPNPAFDGRPDLSKLRAIYCTKHEAEDPQEVKDLLDALPAPIVPGPP